MYAEVFDSERIEQAIAAGIEAVFIVLGEPDIKRRQDPISWDKLFEMTIHYLNKILGVNINTRKLTVETPKEFVSKVVKLLDTVWRPSESGKGARKSFMIKEAETLVGMLGHISNTAPWLKHLMSHLYTSIAAALKSNTSYLVCTNKHF